MKSIATLKRNAVKATYAKNGWNMETAGTSIYDMDWDVTYEIVWNETAQCGGRVTDFFAIARKVMGKKFDFDYAWRFAEGCRNQYFTDKCSVGFVEMSGHYCLTLDRNYGKPFQNPLA
ncbi:MAG: hypothetical protein J6T33_01695 [Bacteroidales bacterium]|nr:hypothetical protein [Bacteroidales bacterium]